MLKHLLVLTIIMLTLSSLHAQVQNVKKLDPQGFDNKLKETKYAVLIDVRTSAEYAQGHLANAQLFDIYASDFKNRVSKLDKSKPVFVYCKAGSRSSSAVEILSDMGFKEIYDLNGGINAWRKESKPIVNK